MVTLTRRRFCLGMAAAGLLAPLGLAGCRRAAVPVTVAFHPWPGYAPLELARQLGEWPQAWLQALPTASATASVEALLAGTAQAAALTLDEALRLNARLPLAVIAIFDQSLGADVVLGRQPWPLDRSPQGLRVAVETGTVGALMLSAWLQQAGLARDAITVVPMAVAAQETAWHNGEIDACVTYEPVASHLLALGARRWFDSSQLPDTTPILDVLVVRADALDRHSQALRHLVDALFAGQRHWRELPLDAAYRLSPWLRLPREQVAASFKRLKLTDWYDNRSWLVGDPPRLRDVATGLAAWMRAQGLLAGAEPSRPLALDARFLPREAPL